MSYEKAANKISKEPGVQWSTMMKTPCLRYKKQFMAMWFDQEDALIIKVAPERVSEIIAEGKGKEFNFTKKPFKEWVLIPRQFENDYEAFLFEALQYAKDKSGM